MKKLISAVALLFALLMMLSVPVSAASAYQTYTYSIDGMSINSPAAYTPVQAIDSAYMGLATAIDDPRDMVVDKDYNVYIADAKNNRIVCLDRYYKVKFTIDTFTNEYGVPDELKIACRERLSEDLLHILNQFEEWLTERRFFRYAE